MTTQRSMGVLVLVLLVVGSSALMGQAQTSTTYDLTWHVIGGGGAPISSASYRVNSTAGQSAASPPAASSASYVVSSGYWRCAVAGDVNDNGVVDMDDIQAVASAWGDIPAPGYADRDGDGDVDVVDIQQVTAHWGEVC